MTTQEMIAVMQAAVNGKTIQYRTVNASEREEWDDCEPRWDWSHAEYRVKPEPREWWICSDCDCSVLFKSKKHAESVCDSSVKLVHVREVLE